LCKKPLLKLVFQKKPPALAGGVVTFQAGSVTLFFHHSQTPYPPIKFLRG
jgi:hypothetical protein